MSIWKDPVSWVVISILVVASVAGVMAGDDIKISMFNTLVADNIKVQHVFVEDIVVSSDSQDTKIIIGTKTISWLKDGEISYNMALVGGTLVIMDGDGNILQAWSK